MKIINYDKNIFLLLNKANKLENNFSMIETIPKIMLIR